MPCLKENSLSALFVLLCFLMCDGINSIEYPMGVVKPVKDRIVQSNCETKFGQPNQVYYGNVSQEKPAAFVFYVPRDYIQKSHVSEPNLQQVKKILNSNHLSTSNKFMPACQNIRPFAYSHIAICCDFYPSRRLSCALRSASIQVLHFIILSYSQLGSSASSQRWKYHLVLNTSPRIQVLQNPQEPGYRSVFICYYSSKLMLQ